MENRIACKCKSMTDTSAIGLIQINFKIDSGNTHAHKHMHSPIHLNIKVFCAHGVTMRMEDTKLSILQSNDYVHMNSYLHLEPFIKSVFVN